MHSIRLQTSRAIVVRAASAVLLGMLAFAWPWPTVRAAGLLFALYTLIDGSAAIAFATPRRGSPSWELIVEGTTGIAFALLALVAAFTDVTVLAFVVGLWAVMAGAFRFSAAAVSRRLTLVRPLVLGGGLATVALGAIVLSTPAIATASLMRVVGIYGLLFGAIHAMVALRIRRYAFNVAT